MEKAGAPAFGLLLAKREKSEAAKGGERPDARWRVKRVRRPCGAARAGAAGGGGRAGGRTDGRAGGGGHGRPRHTPAKGANWREEQGAGLDARLGARLEGACAGRGACWRRAASTSGAGRGAEG